MVRDIVPVGVPFASGVAASAFFSLSGACAHLFLAASSIMLLLLLRFRGRCGLVVYAAMFFCLGAFCGSGRTFFGAGADTVPGFASAALSRLETLIASVDYPHERTGALLRALLTGQRDGLAAGTLQAFRDAGASHILALSGLHLGLIYAIAGRLLKILGNSRPAYILRSVLLVSLSAFYTLMTGASPSIARAFIFIVFNEYARLSPGRLKKPANIWCAALMLQLAINPSVVSSAGFQLSYLAMLGIYMLYPVLDGWYPRSGRWDLLRRVWSGMALSISCQIFTGPLAWLRFGSFPKYFLLTNLIALPLVSVLMAVAVACLAASAAGVCPEWLVKMTDSLAEALQGCLETIAGM